MSLLGLVLTTGLAAAPPTDLRVVVSVGADLGVGEERPLAYAERDARRFGALMRDSGAVEASRLHTVIDADADAVREALSRASGQLSELARQGPTSIVVYVSSHADEASVHLNGTRLDVEELRARLARMPVDLRVLIIDGCQRAPREKGGVPGPEVKLGFVRGSEVRGEVVIRSASFGEAAQEWAFFEGSLFTHHLLTGLRGVADVDGDGRVSLAEAYAYTFRRTTVSAARSRAGPQHPSFLMDMAGRGEWTMVQPKRLGAAIRLGGKLEGRFWVARAGQLVAEVDKRAGEPLELAVMPGKYVLVQSGGRRARAAELELRLGGIGEVEASDLVELREPAAVLRGEAPVVHRPWSMGAFAEVGTPWLKGSSLPVGGLIRLGRQLGDFELGLVVGLQRTRIEASAATAETWAARAGLASAAMWPVGPLDLGLGVELGLAWVHQSWRRPDAAVLEQVFGVKTEPRTALVPRLAGLGQVGLPFWDLGRLQIGAGPVMRWWPPEEGEPELQVGVEVRAGFELRI